MISSMARYAPRGLGFVGAESGGHGFREAQLGHFFNRRLGGAVFRGDPFSKRLGRDVFQLQLLRRAQKGLAGQGGGGGGLHAVRDGCVAQGFY